MAKDGNAGHDKHLHKIDGQSMESQDVEASIEDDEEIETIFIEDEDGNSHEYQIIMYLEPDGSEHQYVILLSLEEGDEDGDESEVVPFRYKEVDDELQLYPLESEEEWQMVSETFHALYNADDFEDDDQPNHKG